MDVEKEFENIKKLFTVHWQYYASVFCEDFCVENYESGSPVLDVESYNGYSGRILMTHDFGCPYEYVKSSIWGLFYKNVATNYTVEQYYQKTYGVYCFGDIKNVNCAQVKFIIPNNFDNFNIKDCYVVFNDFYTKIRKITSSIPYSVNKFLWYPYGWNCIEKIGDKHYFIVNVIPFCIVTKSALETQKKINKPFELVKIDKI